jgi:hypothetical protein
MEFVQNLFGTPFGGQGGYIEQKQKERLPGSLRPVSFNAEQVVKRGFAVKSIIVFLAGEIGACL